MQRTSSILSISKRFSSKYRNFSSRFNKILNFLPEGNQYVIEKFGKFYSIKQPGLALLIPFVHKIAYQVEMRELCLRVSPEHAFTKDNVQVTLGGNLYIKFHDAYLAAYGANNPIYSTVQLAQAVMRTQVGKLELDELFENRSVINNKVVENMEDDVQPWGCNVKRFEITDLEPTDLKVAEALNRQATAERIKRETILRAQADKEKVQQEAEAYKFRQETEGLGDKTKILARAEAESESIKMISEALQNGNGQKVIEMRLAEEYLKQFGKVAKETNTTILPLDLANIKSIIDTGKQIFKR